MLKHGVFAFLTAMLLGLPLSAQMGRTPTRFSTSSRFAPSTHTRVPRAFFLGEPFWTDSYFPPYDPSPSVIVVQAPSAPVERSSVQIEEPKSAAPLLIEWQGDRYVRRSSAAATSTRATQPDYAADAKPLTNEKHPSVTATPRAEPPPATFVFRDGHREESSDYSIISGVIYARGDYWTSGSWSKQIPIAQLDLPATLRANQERGVAFRLPSAPNEIVTRP